MNRANIEELRDRMLQITRPVFSLCGWGPGKVRDRPIESQDDLANCGMAACVGGHMALLPGFIRDGGTHSWSSLCPEMKGRIGVDAMAYWLGIPLDMADAIATKPGPYGRQYMDQVTPKDVVRVLNHLLEHGVLPLPS